MYTPSKSISPVAYLRKNIFRGVTKYASPSETHEASFQTHKLEEIKKKRLGMRNIPSDCSNIIVSLKAGPDTKGFKPDVVSLEKIFRCLYDTKD